MVNFTILAKGVVALYYQLTDTSHASGITALLRAAYDEYLSIYVDASFQRITHSSGAAQARGGTPTGPPLGQMKEPSSHTHGASSDTRKSMSMVRVDDGRPLTDFERFRTRWHWVIAICKRPPLQIRLQGPTTAESDNRKGFAQLGRNHKAEDSHSRKSSVLSEDEGARTTPHLVRTCLRTLNAPVVIAVCALYCFPSVAAMDPGDTSAPHVRQTAGLNVTATAGLLAVAGFYSLMRDKVSLVFGSIMAGSATTWTVLSTSADVSLTWKFRYDTKCASPELLSLMQNVSMLAIFGVSTLGYVGCRTMQKAMSTP